MQRSVQKSPKLYYGATGHGQGLVCRFIDCACQLFFLALLSLMCTVTLATASDDELEIESIKLTSLESGLMIDLVPVKSQVEDAGLQKTAAAELEWSAFRNPDRLVVDTTSLRFQRDARIEADKVDGASAKGAGLLKGIQFGRSSDGGSRIIMSLAQFALPDVIVAQDDGSIRIALLPVEEPDFINALDGLEPTAQAGPAGSLTNSGPEPFKVVIDPGHGGIDGGASSRNGKVVEKHLTLAMAKALKAELEDRSGFDVVLTRDGDEFLRLSERVKRARAEKADLMISIHADSLRQAEVRGATIYTLSKRATDEVSAALAEAENRVDLLAGLELPSDDEGVTDILIDLARLETKGFSRDFSKILLTQLRGNVRLIGNPQRAASFRVLKAPDVPSVLFEMGYLSNDADAKLLSQPSWQKKLAGLLAEAIEIYREDTGRGMTVGVAQ
jgi:N-acetylmuramoyl-L-alanine amidase